MYLPFGNCKLIVQINLFAFLDLSLDGSCLWWFFLVFWMNFDEVLFHLWDFCTQFVIFGLIVGWLLQIFIEDIEIWSPCALFDTLDIWSLDRLVFSCFLALDS